MLNKELLERTAIQPISLEVKRHRWIRLVCRLPLTSIPRVAMRWTPGVGLIKPHTFTNNYAVYRSQLTVAIQCSLQQLSSLTEIYCTQCSLQQLSSLTEIYCTQCSLQRLSSLTEIYCTLQSKDQDYSDTDERAAIRR